MTDDAFDTGVVALAPRLRAFIRRRVRDDATADDLAQDTLLKVYRSRAVLRDGTRLEAWLYRIARRSVIDHYRRRRPGEELPESLAAESNDEIAEFRRAVVETTRCRLAELPVAYREPVRLAELEGRPLAAVATDLGLSLTAVKSRVRRGRQMLKAQLQACCRFEHDAQGSVIGWERRRPDSCGGECD